MENDTCEKERPFAFNNIRIQNLKYSRSDLVPLILEGTIRSLFTCPVVPIISIPGVAFLAVEVGMNPSSIAVGAVLNNLVRFFPISLSVVPQSLRIQG